MLPFFSWVSKIIGNFKDKLKLFVDILLVLDVISGIYCSLAQKLKTEPNSLT